MGKKLTKKDIDKLAVEIRKWARSNKLNDYSMLYNGKWWHHEYSGSYQQVEVASGITQEKWVSKSKLKITKKDPHDFCEWFSEKFILGICADGSMYECLNEYNRYKAKEKLDALLESYGLYIENCDGCHFDVVPDTLDIEDIEYTFWPKEKIVWLYGVNRSDGGDIPNELNTIMDVWYNLSKEVGDIGCCTIGEYMEFHYKGIKYRMSPQSPYQGDYSWSCNVPKVKELLEKIGATDIYMNYGRMD